MPNAPTGPERVACEGVWREFHAALSAPTHGRFLDCLPAVRRGVTAPLVRGIVQDMRAAYSNPNYVTWSAFCRDAARVLANARAAGDCREGAEEDTQFESASSIAAQMGLS